MSSNKRLRLSDPSSITPEASTSSSPIQNSFKYDVFISFRGEDTRNTFVGHLYQALKDKGIYTYKDDEKIDQGKTIDNQLVQAIKDSRFFIIVFSKNYASSSWCLDELVEIMGCQKTGKQTAYPVFFDVEPTQVRKQSGAVKEAFVEHEKKEAAGKWREAMKEASNLAGWELKATANGNEAEFIKIIVGEISLELRSINSGFDEKLVGMETRVKDVVSSLELGADEVRFIGIKGMGGAGKTTTARAVFDNLSNDFEAKSFVENVREVSNGAGLKKLQEQVLLKVLNEHVTLDSVNDGKNMMKRRMCGKKLLLVLDDVDHIDQLEALAGGPSWFKPGSRIIVTTRDEQVLVANRVNLIRDIDLLSEQEAICLFSRYAFGTENPIQGYAELSGKVVRYAVGLPLTIKVLGSFLCGKDIDVWEDAIERLKDIPLKETLEKLELSYMSLEDDYKEIFLDIACIFKGETKEDAIRILECCGFHARIGLKVLEQRSLITVNKYGGLGMHDHIEEMGKNIVRHVHIKEKGKNIVRREHRDEPNKHSRLWISEEIEYILTNDLGTEETRCLKLKNSTLNARIVMKGLGKMKKLSYLDVHFKDDLFGSDQKFADTSQLDIPNSLKYLKCLYYPFLYLPKTFQADNLVGLEMDWSGRLVQLWEEGEKKVLKKLKFLSLFKSKLTTFDFRITPNLETLFLNLSRDLAQLFMPASCQKLKYVHISSSKLRTFDLGLTPNLETLSLKSCDDFEDLRVSVACPNLKILDLSYSRLVSLDLGMIPNLESLDLNQCRYFVKLQVSAPCPNLKSLNLSGSRLRSLDLELFPNLERLDLKWCRDFVELQVSAPITNLKFLNLCESGLRSLDLELIPNLERLDLNRCDDFVELHVSAPITNLKFLNLCESGLRSLNLELIPNLESLDLSQCHELVEINAPIGCLERVGNLQLRGCLRFTSFKFCRSEPKLSFSLATLDLFGQSLDSCPLHPNSNLPKLQFDCSYEEYLSSSVGNIERLISFGLCACTDFKKFSDIICSLQCLKQLELKCNIPEFPKDLGRLECLEELCLSSTKIKRLPGSICMLKRLKSLEVNNCDLLEKLPEDLGRLQCLEELRVSSKKIEYLPDSICMLKCLKVLGVIECCCLGKLPEDIGQLECLEKLYLLATMIKHLPDSVCMLKHLNDLSLGRCGLLEKLPENLGRLGCLKYLDIRDTGISRLPQSIFGLKGLHILASQEILQQHDFP